MIRLISLLFISVFISGCSSYYAQGYLSSSDYFQIETSYGQFYVNCDEQWHSSRCDEKLYSYTKIKQVDFPVNYRVKHRECTLPVNPNTAGQTSAFYQ